MRPTGASWLVVVCLAVTIPSSFAQSPAPPPRGPGAIALLANVSDHIVDGALREALRDPDPSVRIVAARVVAVVPHSELIRDILGALAREKDSGAAAELGRCLLYLGGADSLDIVKTQAARFGPALAPVIAEWTGRLEPQRFAAALPDLVKLTGDSSGPFAGIVWMTITTHPAQRDAILRRWMETAPQDTWSEMLDREFAGSVNSDGGVSLLKDALTSDRAAIREETVWFVLRQLASRKVVPAEILDAALPRDVGGQTNWERLGREFVSRRHKKTAPQDSSDLLKTEAAGHLGDAATVQPLPELTAAERAALSTLSASADVTWDPDWTGLAAARTVPPLVPGLVGETLSSAGCKLTTRISVAAASVTFRSDGRPQRLEVGAGSLVPACLTAFRALARLTVADEDYPIGPSPQLLMLPFTSTFIACSDAPADPFRSGPYRAAKISSPRKLREVPPVYPEDARRQSVQGVVVVASTISHTGCISEARVVRSIPLLDLAALVAVSQWSFEPARIDGVPRAVLMNVLVNFTLQ